MYLKGKVSDEDFWPSVFFIKQFHLGPWFTGWSCFAYVFVFDEKIYSKIAKIWFRVNDTAESMARDTAMLLTVWNPNFWNDYLDFLCEYEAICETAEARESVLSEGRKSRDTAAINWFKASNVIFFKRAPAYLISKGAATYLNTFLFYRSRTFRRC
jgi:hypothetical protein